MANFGLSKPWMAHLNPSTGAYSDAFKCGRAVNTSVVPNYNNGQMYADNKQTEDVSEFKNASVTLGVDALPLAAPNVLFGHTVAQDGTENSNSDDSGSFVGYGFITNEIADGVKKYRACLLLKVKFVEGEESYQTKGDSITFANPNLTGTALAMSNGDWRRKSPYFTTEAEADAWIQTQLGVTPTPGGGDDEDDEDGEGAEG